MKFNVSNMRSETVHDLTPDQEDDIIYNILDHYGTKLSKTHFDEALKRYRSVYHQLYFKPDIDKIFRKYKNYAVREDEYEEDEKAEAILSAFIKKWDDLPDDPRKNEEQIKKYNEEVKELPKEIQKRAQNHLIELQEKRNNKLRHKETEEKHNEYEKSRKKREKEEAEKLAEKIKKDKEADEILAHLIATTTEKKTKEQKIKDYNEEIKKYKEYKTKYEKAYEKARDNVEKSKTRYEIAKYAKEFKGTDLGDEYKKQYDMTFDKYVESKQKEINEKLAKLTGKSLTYQNVRETIYKVFNNGPQIYPANIATSEAYNQYLKNNNKKLREEITREKLKGTSSQARAIKENDSIIKINQQQIDAYVKDEIPRIYTLYNITPVMTAPEPPKPPKGLEEFEEPMEGFEEFEEFEDDEPKEKSFDKVHEELRKHLASKSGGTDITKLGDKYKEAEGFDGKTSLYLDSKIKPFLEEFDKRYNTLKADPVRTDKAKIEDLTASYDNLLRQIDDLPMFRELNKLRESKRGVPSSAAVQGIVVDENKTYPDKPPIQTEAPQTNVTQPTTVDQPTTTPTTALHAVTQPTTAQQRQPTPTPPREISVIEDDIKKAQERLDEANRNLNKAGMTDTEIYEVSKIPPKIQAEIYVLKGELEDAKKASTSSASGLFRKHKSILKKAAKTGLKHLSNVEKTVLFEILKK